MHKFTSNIDYLRQYVNGELDPTEMYEIERAMHTDEMLMDIIEGLETEKLLKSNAPIVELHKEIASRSHNAKPTKILPFKKIAIAASIIAVLTLGGLYFIAPSNDNSALVAKKPVATDIIPMENKVDEIPYVDSSLVAYSEIENTKDIESPKVSNNKKSKTISIEKETPKKLMAYSPKPSMQVVIEGPRYLNKINEEIIPLGTKGETKPAETELLSTRIGTAYQRPANTSSIGKTQADLQKLDLDPQTKANLSLVLSRQALENNTAAAKEKQTETSLEEVFGGGNILANKKLTESSILLSAESYGTIAVKPIQNGNPSIGWVQFNAYIKNQLLQKGFKKYNVNLSFDLDESLKPTNIKINSSSDSKVNKNIISILRGGPSWEGKDPNHPIFIRISSEEASN